MLQIAPHVILNFASGATVCSAYFCQFVYAICHATLSSNQLFNITGTRSLNPSVFFDFANVLILASSAYVTLST